MVRSRVRASTNLGVAAGVLGALAGIGSPAAASPIDAAAGVDLECFDTPGAPLHLELRLSHLDPALAQLGLPAHSVVVRELVQTCIAVESRGIPPPAAAPPGLSQVNLACYRIDAAALAQPAPLALEHAAPALATLSGHGAALVQPVELCLPVVRDGVAPPPDVRRMVQSIALECYAVAPGPHPAFGVGLVALDPQLAGVVDRQLALGAERRQVCVPVAKNSERIPNDVLGIVRRLGVEQLAASRPAAARATRVVLRHLNPLFATLPAVPVVLQQASGLMVPVSRRAPPAP